MEDLAPWLDFHWVAVESTTRLLFTSHKTLEFRGVELHHGNVVRVKKCLVAQLECVRARCLCPRVGIPGPGPELLGEILEPRVVPIGPSTHEQDELLEHSFGVFAGPEQDNVLAVVHHKREAVSREPFQVQSLFRVTGADFVKPSENVVDVGILRVVHRVHDVCEVVMALHVTGGTREYVDVLQVLHGDEVGIHVHLRHLYEDGVTAQIEHQFEACLWGEIEQRRVLFDKLACHCLVFCHSSRA